MTGPNLPVSPFGYNDDGPKVQRGDSPRNHEGHEGQGQERFRQND